jgi:hypothetical protein
VTNIFLKGVGKKDHSALSGPTDMQIVFLRVLLIASVFQKFRTIHRGWNFCSLLCENGVNRGDSGKVAEKQGDNTLKHNQPGHFAARLRTDNLPGIGQGQGFRIA